MTREVISMTGRGARGLRGEKGDTGNGANPFPPLGDETALYVIDESYQPGDMRRYGMYPDDGIDHSVVNPGRLNAWVDALQIPTVTGYMPRGTYLFPISITALDNIKIIADYAIVEGLFHITGGSSDIDILGDLSIGGGERFGLANDATSSRVRLGRIHALGASRCIHIAGPTDLQFELLHVEDTDTCDASGDYGNLAAVFIEMQGLGFVRGHVQVDNSQTNGFFLNALDGAVTFDVRGYGGTVIDADTNALQGLSTAQTERGHGVILHRYQGTYGGKIAQANASPGVDAGPLWVPETGTSAVTSSRYKPAIQRALDATVGNGCKGVLYGPDGGSFTVCNVAIVEDGSITLRTANTLASGYAGMTVTPPAVGDNCHVRIGGGGRITLPTFGGVKSFKATAPAATADDNNYTMLDNLKLALIDLTGSNTTPNVELDGTGGYLWGALDLGALHCVSGSSFSSALISLTALTDMRVSTTSITAAANTNSTAVAFIGNTDCIFDFPHIYGFYRNPDGAVYTSGTNTGCKFNGGTLTHGAGATTGYGFRFGGTMVGCEFNGWRPTNFDVGFKANTPTFTNCTARGCISPADGAGNDDATDLTTAQFAAANQFGCVNFAV